MTNPSRGGFEMSFTLGKPKPRAPEKDDTLPFKILVAGDFSGRSSRSERLPLAQAVTPKVDIDTLESVLRKLNPTIALQTPSGPLTISFSELEDFHPDRLCSRIPWFGSLQKIRAQLKDPKTSAQAVALLTAPQQPVTQQSTDQPPAESEGDTLQRLLGKPAAQAPAQTAAGPGIIDSLLRQAVAPHVVQGPDPRAADLVPVVDNLLADLMRTILHNPAFQTLESTWRSLDLLVRNLDLDERLSIQLLDVTREELEQDLLGAEDLSKSALYKLVVEHAGKPPWSLWIADYPFQPTQGDAALVARLGAIAHQAGAPLLLSLPLDLTALTLTFASAQDREAWAALRSLPYASSLGVALPRVLLRQPYGKGGETLDSFAFEEQPTPPDHKRYLWGNPAFVCAYLLGRSFSEAEGWDFSPGSVSELEGLPIHTYRLEGESVQTPCAEVWLSESKIDALIKEGLIPLVSVQGSDKVRVVRLQSISSPPQALAGRWA